MESKSEYRYRRDALIVASLAFCFGIVHTSIGLWGLFHFELISNSFETAANYFQEHYGKTVSPDDAILEVKVRLMCSLVAGVLSGTSALGLVLRKSWGKLLWRGLISLALAYYLIRGLFLQTTDSLEFTDVLVVGFIAIFCWYSWSALRK